MANEFHQSDFIELTIVGWEKFNGRKDVAHPTWFRVQYRLLEDPDFYHFTHEEMLVWFYIMAQACRKASATVRVYFLHAHATRKISRRGILSAIKKLQELKLVTIDVTPTLRGRDVHDTRQDRQDKTEQDRQDKTPSPTPPAPAFDFETAYQTYPRKIGKAAGMKSLLKQIKTQTDFEDFSRAVENYAKAVIGSEEKYIKHFSSFVGSERSDYPWREWVNYQPRQPMNKAEVQSSTNLNALKTYLSKKGIEV